MQHKPCPNVNNKCCYQAGSEKEINTCVGRRVTNFLIQSMRGRELASIVILSSLTITGIGYKFLMVCVFKGVRACLISVAEFNNEMCHRDALFLAAAVCMFLFVNAQLCSH